MSPVATPIPEVKYINLSTGHRIHYQEVGDGFPIVFLHGSGPGASGYSNFKHNYDVFAAAGFRAVVIDLPGFGLSSKPDDVNYDTDFFVATLDAFLNAMDIQSCALLGNSLGGAIALHYQLAHPGRVKKLILMAPGGVEERETYFQMEGIQKMVAAFSAGPITVDIMRQLMSLQLHDPSLISEELLVERVGVCALQPKTIFSTMRVPNIEHRLGEITIPVLGFWGMNDKFNPVSGAQKITNGCPDSKMTLINRCGHWVMVEHRDYFNRACIDFLSTH